MAIAKELESAYMDEAAKSKSDAFEALVREYSRFVFKVAYAVVRDSADAEDVVQEVFLRVYRKGTSGVTDTKSWLARIAYRVALDHAKQRRAAAVDIEEAEVAGNDAPLDEDAIKKQQSEVLRSLIAALPEDLRTPLVLSSTEEMNSREIAEMMEIPEGSVRTRLMRARQLLKEKFIARQNAPREDVRGK